MSDEKDKYKTALKVALKEMKYWDYWSGIAEAQQKIIEIIGKEEYEDLRKYEPRKL